MHEYIARGGYEALAKALKMKPADIAEEIAKSGLRGRGGGGFPVGIKWKSCMAAGGRQKISYLQRQRRRAGNRHAPQFP